MFHEFVNAYFLGCFWVQFPLERKSVEGCIWDEDHSSHHRKQWEMTKGDPLLGQVGRLAWDGDGSVNWKALYNSGGILHRELDDDKCNTPRVKKYKNKHVCTSSNHTA